MVLIGGKMIAISCLIFIFKPLLIVFNPFSYILNSVNIISLVDVINQAKNFLFLQKFNTIGTFLITGIESNSRFFEIIQYFNGKYPKKKVLSK